MTIGRIPSVEGGIQPTIFDAKADLLTATANDTPARLAVGSNDQVLVADSSTTTGLAWKSYGAQFVAGKNAIINGDFAVNQRAFTSNTAAGAYNFDRFFQNNGGTTGTLTVTPQTFTAGSAPVSGYEATNFVRCVTASGASANTYALFNQSVESVRTFAGQTITISFWAKAGSGTPKIAVELRQNFGSGGSPSSEVQTLLGQVTLSTSWARYSLTVAVPSISGKTIGTTANTSFLQLALWLSAGSDFNARTNTLGLQNATFDLWGFQMEAGSVATPFTTATGTLQGELAACQRYYYRFANDAINKTYFLARNFSTTAARGIVFYPVTMRTAPTFGSSAASTFSVWTNTDFAGTSISGFDLNTTAANIQLSVASGLTANDATAVLSSSSSTTSYLEFSSEL